jgi:phosphonate transport system permease protein
VKKLEHPVIPAHLPVISAHLPVIPAKAGIHASAPISPPLPPPIWDARCKACWFVAAIGVLVIASFWSLDLQWAKFLSLDALQKMGRFVTELLSPNLKGAYLGKLWWATLETLAMSALGTLLAVVLGLLLALPAAQQNPLTRGFTRAALNALRSIPELVWATLLLIAAGLGPMAGTLALALHTAGVLGRLFADAIENTPKDAAFALKVRGASGVQIFCYATLPQILPQLVSYTLYRWENNIRAAAVLGVVGAGGLGQMLSFHMSLFQMAETSSVLCAMLVLVALVDALSFWIRRVLMR